MKKIMKIFKGFHYPLPLDFGGFLLKRVHQEDNYSACASYTFDPSCRYYIDDDQSDVNKLFGFSLGKHHNNSIRIGWRYREDNLEICYYVYRDGKRLPTKVIEKIELRDKPVTINLDLSYIREYNEVSIVIQSDTNKLCKCVEYEYEFPKEINFWSYGLGLYFGGNRTAPHTMKITRNFMMASWGRE